MTSTLTRAGRDLAAPSLSRRFGLGAGTLGGLATVATALVLLVGAALAYEAAFRAGLVQARLLPPPSRVAAVLWRLGRSGALFDQVRATATRVASGFAIGAAAGAALGVLTGASAAARRLLDPSVQALRAFPSLAWMPLFILWLGIFEPSKVALIAPGVFFPVYLGIMAAVLRVDRGLVELGRVHRAGRGALIGLIVLPALLPEAMTALRSGLGLGFMFFVAAEIMAASEGLGYC